MYLGIDLGSSSIKLSVLDAQEGHIIASVTYPENEMKIDAPQPGWAEQNPEDWWSNFRSAFSLLTKQPGIESKKIEGIGISYQMHGLVLVDENQQVLRPSIIWCDSRAVDIGRKAFQELSPAYCQRHMLNSPGNFTASKLAWVKQNQPELFSNTHKFMLPGDFIAMKLSRQVTTTETGLSEGVFWDFEEKKVNPQILDYYGIPYDLIADTVPAIGAELPVHPDLISEFNLHPEAKITYRAGDQPNNAFSLNVLEPGEVAATAGTSGVIYAVTDQNASDPKSRINTFLHVNNEQQKSRNGILICINGTGILYSWLKKLLSTSKPVLPYDQMNRMAEKITTGADGVRFFPFGNGAERVLENKVVGAHLMNMDFNRHSSSHIIRAGIEGIIFALNIGFEMLNDLEVPSETIRVGHSNLFLSKTFREIFTNVTGTTLELYDTDGAAGAARGAALGQGFYASPKEAFAHLDKIDEVHPDPESVSLYKELYGEWKAKLDDIIELSETPERASTTV